MKKFAIAALFFSVGSLRAIDRDEGSNRGLDPCPGLTEGCKVFEEPANPNYPGKTPDDIFDYFDVCFHPPIGPGN